MAASKVPLQVLGARVFHVSCRFRADKALNMFTSSFLKYSLPHVKKRLNTVQCEGHTEIQLGERYAGAVWHSYNSPDDLK